MNARLTQHCSGISFLRDTKRNGDLSKLAVAYALGRAGYIVSKSYGESSRYDLLIDGFAAERFPEMCRIASMGFGEKCSEIKILWGASI